jgi:hypothetical protein
MPDTQINQQNGVKHMVSRQGIMFHLYRCWWQHSTLSKRNTEPSQCFFSLQYLSLFMDGADKGKNIGSTISYSILFAEEKLQLFEWCKVLGQKKSHANSGETKKLCRATLPHWLRKFTKKRRLSKLSSKVWRCKSFSGVPNLRPVQKFLNNLFGARYRVGIGLSYWPARGGIFKLLWSPRINSKESIPPAYVVWRAGTTSLFRFSS